MARPKRTRKGKSSRPKVAREDELIMAARRARVAELYLIGWQQWRIAEEVGTAPSTVSDDLAAIHKQWVESGIRSLDEYKAHEVQVLRRVEREAWAQWERSKEDAQKRVEEDANGPHGPTDKVVKTSEAQCGDPRYLMIVQECVEKRCKILGLYAPVRTIDVDLDGQATSGVLLVREPLSAEEWSAGTQRRQAELIEATIIEEHGNGNGGPPGSNGHDAS